MQIKSTIGVIKTADNDDNDGIIIIGIKNNSDKVLTIEAGKTFRSRYFH